MKFTPYLIALSTLIFACQQHSQDAIERADFTLKAEETLDYLNDIADEQKNNATFYYQRAIALNDLGRASAAYQDILKAVAIDQESERAFLLKGKIEQRLERPEEAIQSLLIAEKLGAREKGLYKILASEYLQLGQVKMARAAVDRLVKLQPDADSHQLEGEVMLAIADTNSAINSFKKAIAINPNLTLANEKLADIYIAQDDLNSAGQIINAYLDRSTNESSRVMLLKKGRILSSLAEYDSAKQVYFNLLAQDSTNYIVHYELSNLYYASNRYDSSAYYSRKAANLDTTQVDAKLLLARSLDKSRSYQEAINIYENIVSKDSTNNLATSELDNLKRKVAYLWQLEQQRKKRDSVLNNLPPTIEKKKIDN